MRTMLKASLGFLCGVVATLVVEVAFLALRPMGYENSQEWVLREIRAFAARHGRLPTTSAELLDDLAERERTEWLRLIDAEYEFVSRNGADGAAATLRVMRRDGNPTLQRRFDAFLEEYYRQRKRCADVR